MSTLYVNKEELYNNICAWQDACIAATEAGVETPQMPNTIGRSILDIAQHMGTRWNFNKYSWVDEMVLDGIESQTKAIRLFDRGHEKKNPFGFLTFICWRAFLNRIAYEKKAHETKMSMMLDETIDSYYTQDADDDMNLGKAAMIDQYSRNSYD